MFTFSVTFGQPRCLRLNSTQTLSLNGVSGFHPFMQQCGPDQKVATPQTSMLSLSGFQPGLYGFYCPNHGDPATGSSMGLAVQVVP